MSDEVARQPRRTAWKEELDALPTRRTCAGCDLCCTVLEITALQKPAGTPCHHLKAGGGGCSIWGEHPPACKTYVCLWRMSDAILPPDMFPARCGFLLTVDDVSTWPMTINVCVDPQTPNAWNKRRYRAIFAGLAEAWNCSVAIVDEAGRARHVFAPTGGSYARAERPDVFPHDGQGLSLHDSDFGPDRRPPLERITERPFRWAERRARPVTRVTSARP